MPEDEAGSAPGTRRHVDAGRDAYIAGRDIHQYLDRSSEVTALEVLNASGGAKRLAELSDADKTLERAGWLLTGVSPSVAVPALVVLLGRDKDLVIALLASIHEAKAESLVSAMGSDGAGLEKLPEAMKAITRCESTTDSALGMPTGRFMRVVSARGTQGFLQTYANGTIHWSLDYGAHAMTGAIAQCHRDTGGCGGLLGFPATTAALARHPRTETECSWQLFEGPSDYSPDVCAYLDAQCGATVVSSRKRGTHATWGSIGELSERGWRDRAWMGLPVDDAVPLGPSRRMNGEGTRGWRQRFESGSVYCSDKTGAIRVPHRWAAYLEGRGDVAGSTGFPVSPVLDAATSPYGTAGHYQRFEGSWDYPPDVVGRWSDQERPGGATIYHSPQYGAHTVERGNGVLYERLNGPASWLGFPTSDETDVNTSADDGRRTIQQFEGGAIFCTRKYDSVPVKREILDYLADKPYSDNRLGFPISGAEPLASGHGDSIQFFEHGVITQRDSLVQAWLDPANDLLTGLSVAGDGLIPARDVGIPARVNLLGDRPAAGLRCPYGKFLSKHLIAARVPGQRRRQLRDRPWFVTMCTFQCVYGPGVRPEDLSDSVDYPCN